ncbi:MAG: alpha/beta hydrolase [Roseivirga sp.]|nr:alpha/beta hydrolase [Roseivirga sp.]
MKFRKSINLILMLLLCVAAAAQEKKSTALANVTVLEKTFEIPDLNRSRKVRVYLPPGYENGRGKYPVLYMHDAQNLFDDATSFVGEWGVDENLNELSESTGLDLIVVGIDNGQENRNTELTPWENERLGKPEGEAYMRFVVEVVKPYIDSRYRTKAGRKHTAVMGSSLGGLISHYAIYTYPRVFGKAGIFSPSYWVSEEVYAYTKNNPLPKDSRLYLLVGQKEGPMMYEQMDKMYAFIKEQGHPAVNISAKTNPEGAHNEKFWRSEFMEAIKWLFEK